MSPQAEAPFTIGSTGQIQPDTPLPTQVTFNGISNTISITPETNNSAEVVIVAMANGFTFGTPPVQPTPQEAGVDENVTVSRDSDVLVTVTITPADETIKYDFSFRTSTGQTIDPVVVCDPIPT
jgi:hypothetical protein